MTSGDQDSFAVEHPDDTVASFEEEGNHFANQVRNWLHQTPAAVPLIVLVISTIVFGLVLGAKFFSRQTFYILKMKPFGALTSLTKPPYCSFLAKSLRLVAQFSPMAWY